jgi:hypothetical protein
MRYIFSGNRRVRQKQQQQQQQQQERSQKHSSLALAYLFQPIAFGTLGHLNAFAVDLVELIGRRLRILFDDLRVIIFCFDVYLSAFCVAVV